MGLFDKRDKKRRDDFDSPVESIDLGSGPVASAAPPSTPPPPEAAARPVAEAKPLPPAPVLSSASTDSPWRGNSCT